MLLLVGWVPFCVGQVEIHFLLNLDLSLTKKKRIWANARIRPNDCGGLTNRPQGPNSHPNI